MADAQVYRTTVEEARYLFQNVQTAYNMLSNVKNYYLPLYNTHYINADWIVLFVTNKTYKFLKQNVQVQQERRIKIKVQKAQLLAELEDCLKMKGLKSTGFKLSSPPDFKWLETALFSIDPYNNFFKWTEASQITVEIGVEFQDVMELMKQMKIKPKGRSIFKTQKDQQAERILEKKEFALQKQKTLIRKLNEELTIKEQKVYETASEVNLSKQKKLQLNQQMVIEHEAQFVQRNKEALNKNREKESVYYSP